MKDSELCHNIIEVVEDGRDWPEGLVVWSRFLEQIDICFGIPYRKALAESHFQTLKQGTLMVEEFWWTFRAEADLTDFNDLAKLVFFKCALTEGLYREIRRLNPPLSTFTEWGEKAVQVDSVRATLRSGTPRDGLIRESKVIYKQE
jgi:hypothetical protein